MSRLPGHSSAASPVAKTVTLEQRTVERSGRRVAVPILVDLTLHLRTH